LKSNRRELALRLLEQEVSLQKQVSLYIDLEDYEKALKSTIKHKDTDLMNFVIYKMQKKGESFSKFLNLGSFFIDRLCSYYRETGQKEQIDFVL